MGWFDRASDQQKRERREFRSEQRRASLEEANRQRAEQRRFEEERLMLERREEDRLRHMDMQDGRFDGRPR